MDVSRYVGTTDIDFEIEFVTPAFLGGADGNADVRTAPFKNLLRRWWRMANGNLSVADLWKKESYLFGTTEKNPDLPNEKNNFGASRLRIFSDTSKFDDIYSEDKNGLSDNFVYLGYGPIQNSEVRRYIRPNTKIEFKISVPEENKKEIKDTLSLVNFFGSVGSRSRKGFGSVMIRSDSGFELSKNIEDLKKTSAQILDWRQCFRNDESRIFPFYFGKDDKGLLIWQTDKFEKWEKVLDVYSEVSKDIVSFLKNNNYPRAILNYPITKHSVKGWERFPSQLIFKVEKQNNGYVGRVFHLPVAIPNDDPNKMRDNLGYNGKIREVWQKIHEILDEKNDDFTRLKIDNNGGTAK